MSNEGNDFEKLRNKMEAKQASISSNRDRKLQQALDLQKAGHEKLQNVVIPFVENQMPAASAGGFSLDFTTRTVMGNPLLITGITIELSPAANPATVAQLTIHQEGEVFVVQATASGKRLWGMSYPVESIAENSAVSSMFSHFMGSVAQAWG